jgi:hypothetical protein
MIFFMFVERCLSAAIVNYMGADVKLFGGLYCRQGCLRSQAIFGAEFTVECCNIYHVVKVIISLNYAACFTMRCFQFYDRRVLRQR